jgi:diguanylate cyclase (GGDEF)-like protein
MAAGQAIMPATEPDPPAALGGVDLRQVGGDRLAELVLVIQQLSLARDVAAVQDVVKRAARRLVRADGASFILRDGDMCFYVDEDAISPLWKGRRFPIETCVSGWAMQHRESVAISDVFADDRVPHDAYRPTFVRSLLMTPIRTVEPLGAIGVYWADRHEVSDEERAVLQALADTTAVAVQSAQLWEELEARVAARTRQLADEVEERRRAEQRVRELSLTDDLTGLRNRRGFLMLANHAGGVEPRTGEHGLVVFVDLDGLKAVNDTLGHAAGDALLRAAAGVLRRSFRSSDVLGRVGGDEFAVYVPHTSDHAEAVVARIDTETAEVNAAGTLPSWLSLSVGVARADRDTGLEELLSRADQDMYRHKQARDRAPAGG